AWLVGLRRDRSAWRRRRRGQVPSVDTGAGAWPRSWVGVAGPPRLLLGVNDRARGERALDLAKQHIGALPAPAGVSLEALMAILGQVSAQMTLR
ncbi:MAG: hypothetical protein WCG47_18080, partial [Dermatophilaceae bacterium]